METETNYTYQDYMNDNNVVVTDLSEKAQRLIAKFNATDDEYTLEALEEKILNCVEDYIEDRDKKAKEAERKAKFEAAKKEKQEAEKKEKQEAAKKEKQEAEKNKTTVKVDVSKAPTVKPDVADKNKTNILDLLFGK